MVRDTVICSAAVIDSPLMFLYFLSISGPSHLGKTHFTKNSCMSASFEYLGMEAPWREDLYLLHDKDLTQNKPSINVKTSLDEILQSFSVLNKITGEVVTAGVYLRC